MGRNIGWLLGGRGFAGVVSIAYLAFAARALGPAGFGTFALILAYGGSIAGLAEFRSWQAVIRFGSIHLDQHQPRRLARLLGFTATLDCASALAGAVLAAVGVHFAAPFLGWTVDQQYRAAAFGAALLLSTGATPSGLLRLHDRFDLLTYAEAVGPSVRLAGAAVAWGVGADVNWFLVIWAAAALAESAAAWVAVLLLKDTRMSFGRAAFAAAISENPKIWSFMLMTNLSSSISLLWQQLGTLAVGASGGPAAAGAFRIAGKLAGALAKPVETITRVLYPELAKLAASENRVALRRVVSRVTVIAAALALVMVAAAWLGGTMLLRAFSGSAFVFAQPFLLLLTIAAAIDLCGIALEPVLTAHGRAGTVLKGRVAGATIYVLALVVLMPVIGSSAAAVAAIASSIVIRGLLAAATVRSLRD